MDQLFLKIMNMSLTTSYVILLVILIRLPLRKVPKIYSYSLWIIVLFRLLVPFSFSSVFSMIPMASNPIPADIIYAPKPEIHSGITRVDKVVNNSLPAPVADASVNPIQIWILLGQIIWLAGILLLLIYCILTTLKLTRKLKSSQHFKDNIYKTNHIETPFVFGVLRPKIYIPFSLSEIEQSYIIKHEQTHISRLDHIIKFVFFIAVSIHWFNPLVWLAFFLMSKDMELSCDEKVISEMGNGIKKDYSQSLLSLSSSRGIIGGSPLAFGGENTKGRIKNILNYKKPGFWVSLVGIIIIAGAVIGLLSNPKEQITKDPVPDNATLTAKDLEANFNTIITKDSRGSQEIAKETTYDKVKIEFLSENMGFKSENKVEISDSKIVAYIDSTIRASLTPAENSDIENNHTNQYRIELSNNIGGYSCLLYYDSLYDKAYLVKDGGLDETGVDFARYIDSLMENTGIIAQIEDAEVMELFQSYGWTLDYQINKLKNNLGDLNALSDFNPNQYYFAYHNELSKDIGLDMKGYANSNNINVEIYRIHESMPQEFYPTQDGRGIVVKEDDKIIGAFISAGRHSTFNACSLKGNSFEKATGQMINKWFEKMIDAGSTEKKLSKLEPEQVIEEYFTALNNKDTKAAAYCISKKSLLGNLTSNMPNDQLFNQGINLPLTNTSMGAKSNFGNLKSAKLLQIEQIVESDENTKKFGLTMDLQYRVEGSTNSGEQYWDCHMVYESPQTGWKIEEFGH